MKPLDSFLTHEEIRRLFMLAERFVVKESYLDAMLRYCIEYGKRGRWYDRADR